jgi:hypothetical protein
MASFGQILNACGEAFAAGRPGNHGNHRNPFNRVQTPIHHSPLTIWHGERSFMLPGTKNSKFDSEFRKRHGKIGGEQQY